MAQEFTFRSPNFYEREIDLTAPVEEGPTGTPGGLIGTANKGPAFVPVTVPNYDKFKTVFGSMDVTRMAPYAAKQWLTHRGALTYLRVLGCGANITMTDIDDTRVTGRVHNAGFKISGSQSTDDTYLRTNGFPQFIAGRHTLQTDEAVGMPIFTENDSRSGASAVNLVRGIVFLPYTARLMVLDGNESTTGKFVASGPDDVGTVVSGKVKLVISSTLGATFSTQDSIAGIKVMTASLDPTDQDYFARVLNTDPDKFYSEQHYLYTDFAVDDELATVTTVAVLSGSARASTVSADTDLTMIEAFGEFDTRYKTPSTPWIISQPFGATEHDLIRFEALDDGEYANKLYKISITNLKMSEDESYKYGTFTVNIRDWNDTDLTPIVLESFVNCSLDPYSENYVAKKIGDRKVYFDFDAILETERRLIATGKYPNVSKYVRVVVADKVDRALVPAQTLPFGFRGMRCLKTNDALTDLAGTSPNVRLAGRLGTTTAGSALSGSILPPIPFRFKVTRGTMGGVGTIPFMGYAAPSEIVSTALHWGVKFERNTTVLNPNVSIERNDLLGSLTKYPGIEELDVVVTGSGADSFNNNKFTLARVAFPNSALTHLTSSVTEHMKSACYLRNAKMETTTYTITDPSSSSGRVTFATLAASSSITFNKFQAFAKFTTFMYGGFDGLNMLDRCSRLMNDRGTSFDTGGAALAGYTPTGFSTSQNGAEGENSTVHAYKTAIDIMTDGMVASHNVLAIPGITESYITDYAAQKTKDYGLALYVMDIPDYSDSSVRLYLDQTTRPSVDQTSIAFAGRVIDNNYAATYWPNVYIDDTENKRRVKVSPSVAAFGAIAFNDKVGYPWFAPAGFNRAALDFVTNVTVRLNTSDRDTLYDQRINPIATWPKLGYVIYGQKDLQLSKSALDRVNVRRMLLEVKRIVIDIARRVCFDQNVPTTRNKFVADVNLQLGLVQAASGIESFRTIVNETNNTEEDKLANRLNGTIVVVPTRTIEFVQLDFVITNNSAQFV